MDTYFCEFHNVELERGASCQSCLDEYPNLPDVTTMSIEDRVTELRLRLTAPMTIPFKMSKSRLNALVGRYCVTSEFGNVERLVDEIRTGETPSLVSIIADMAKRMNGTE